MSLWGDHPHMYPERRTNYFLLFVWRLMQFAFFGLCVYIWWEFMELCAIAIYYGLT